MAVGLARERLPLLWDCDFMLGEQAADDPPRCVLCEINVSSVSPLPKATMVPPIEFGAAPSSPLITRAVPRGRRRRVSRA